MTTATLWLEITIAGFLYVVAGFFAVLTILGIQAPVGLSTFGLDTEMLPYVSAVIVATSFISGIVTLRLGQILHFELFGRRRGGMGGTATASTFSPGAVEAPNVDPYFLNMVMVWQKGSDRLLRELDYQYSLCALLGSLQVSIPLVGLTLAFWLWSSGISYAWLPLVAGGLGAAAIVVAFRRQRRGYVNYRDAAIILLVGRPPTPSEPFGASIADTYPTSVP